ncbi:ABC transporter ATP-binding protein [Salinibacterium sp. G-O1]|uniref:ABC transporter ATP-binding protein n=1 Tax=Salinibacterium sp. G-O1 TaxID=3046208 RepID=UPI0024BA287F|nr:ABC transporter ATP-binding protein [Salinibacterium sp. G-O1]MDJ0336530.1 ABC transporter ATP-binding protein [Salinibacterium sp. G-O1]
MSDSTVIAIRDVSKRFILHKEKSLKERMVNIRNRGYGREDFWALRNVSLDIQAGETIGLIGANGSGKSTLLKVIGGIIQPTNGSVQSRGRLAALLELGAGFHPDLSGRDNVYLNAGILGLSKKQTDKYFDAIVDFSGIEEFIDTQVKFYSSGMYVRLAFAVAVHVDPEILLVDEVLAVGDEPFQRKCMDKIRSFQAEARTIVLVSHSADAIGSTCTRAALLNHGEVLFDGAPDQALRLLRQGFADDAEEASSKAEIAGPTIESAALRRSSGEIATGKSSPGDSFVFDIVIDSRGQELHDWVVGMGIDTPLGQTVYGTNTKLLGVNPAPFTGRFEVSFELPELILGKGQYTLHASLGTVQDGSYFRIPQAARLDFENSRKDSGVITVRSSCAIKPPQLR